MANQFFKVKGAKELGAEMIELSHVFQDKMVIPSLKAGAEVTRQQAEQDAPKDKGYLKKAIKVQLSTRGKGTVIRIGVLDDSATNDKGRKVALYAAVQEGRTHYLSRALKTTKRQAEKKIVSGTQKRLSRFHASKGDKGKI